MSWVPIDESEIDFLFESPDASINGSTITGNSMGSFSGSYWSIGLDNSTSRMRVTFNSYSSEAPFGEGPSEVSFTNNEGTGFSVENEAADQEIEFSPSPLDSIALMNGVSFLGGSGSETGRQVAYSILVEVFVLGPIITGRPNYVYELDKGWSFDGNYIPHYVELNWYFGDNPVDYRGVQKLRIHGLTKGRCFLEVASNGMQTDYIEDYSEAQYINLPRNPTLISTDYVPITNYAEPLNRGISVQFKFQGSNTDITLPEPGHVIQVLIVQSTTDGNRAN